MRKNSRDSPMLASRCFDTAGYEVHFHQVGVMLQTTQSNVLARNLLKMGGRH